MCDEVIVCDAKNHRLQVFTSDLVFVRQIGSLGQGNGQFLGPWDVTHDEDGNLYVCDSANNRVQVFDRQGNFLHVLVAPDRIINPIGITFRQGLVYVTSNWRKLYVYHKNGEDLWSFPCGSDKGGVSTDQDGFIYTCGLDKNEVTVF